MFLDKKSGLSGAREANYSESDITDEIQGIRGTLPLPSFQVAVVVDYLINPGKLNESEISELEGEINTPELVRRAPRNSIIARLISRRQDFYDSTPRIFFPVDSHNPDPLKPGEQVFVFFADQIQNDQIGYWWKRKPDTSDADDLNFTHGDRKFEYTNNLGTKEKFQGTPPPAPSFYNGGADQDEEGFTLSGPEAYKNIQRNAKANNYIVKEPVARFDKRPGDNVFQGSNASRVVLGLDRNGSADQPPRPKSAAIDLVVGYGREGTPTAPIVIQNANGEQEVDKVPEKSKKIANPREGDPDFNLDPSRIYISESSATDLDFNIVVPGVVPSLDPAPSIVARSDRIRIDSRENLIVKAGNTSIVVDSQGNIKFIASTRIDLGTSETTLGVARITDTVTADLSSDNQYFQFLNSLGTYVAALGNALSAVGAPPPPPAINAIPAKITGKITQGSTKVFSD